MGQQKRYNTFFLAAILVLVGGSIWWLFLRQPFNTVFKLGLDLQSGTHLLLALEPDLKWNGSQDDINAAQKALDAMQKKNVSPDVVKPLESALGEISGHMMKGQSLLPQRDFSAASKALGLLGNVKEAEPWKELFGKLDQHPSATLEDLSRVKDVLQKRTNEFGTKEPIIQNFGADHIIVDIPAETDPKKAEQIVSRQAYLEFKELTPQGLDFFQRRNGAIPSDYQDPFYSDPMMWRSFMNGSALKEAYEEPQGGSQGAGTSYVVAFSLTDEGRRFFGDATTRNVGKPIAIYLDGITISAPNVKEPITQGSGIIESFTQEKAHELAVYLRAGALPIPIKVVESVTVGPTLGHEALLKSLSAGILGLVMVIIFMLAFYRLPGFIANLALLVYALWLMVIMSVFFVLTLPGIAGVVLSIGMAVDANILIFERVKEELWSGKSIGTAVDIGFHRAWSSIWDSHITTIIGAAALIWKGSSSIQGFGMALLVGTILSLVTAWGVTQVVMHWTVLNNVTTSRTAYGA